MASGCGISQGLLSFIQAQFSPKAAEAVPPLSDKARWYAYWDKDANGSLEKEEVVRALLKTLNLGRDPVSQLPSYDHHTPLPLP